MFPGVQRGPPVLQFVPIASDPVTGHLEPVSILFVSSLQLFLYIDNIPTSLLQAEQS